MLSHDRTAGMRVHAFPSRAHVCSGCERLARLLARCRGARDNDCLWRQQRLLGVMCVPVSCSASGVWTSNLTVSPARTHVFNIIAPARLLPHSHALSSVDDVWACRRATETARAVRLCNDNRTPGWTLRRLPVGTGAATSFCCLTRPSTVAHLYSRPQHKPSDLLSRRVNWPSDLLS